MSRKLRPGVRIIGPLVLGKPPHVLPTARSLLTMPSASCLMAVLF